MHKVHHLRGCTAEPLISYLKALGVLRTVAQQEDAGARGAWENNRFVLYSKLDRDELCDFFLHRYRPAPLTAPWNGGSGYWGEAERRKAKNNLEVIASSSQPRLESLARAIKQCQEILRSFGFDLSKSLSFTKVTKLQLIERLRAEMTDDFVEIMDVIIAFTEGRAAFAPLMGSGGNDGNLEFTATFIAALLQVIPAGQKSSKKEHKSLKLAPERLQKSLFDEGDASLSRGSAGQFYPGGTGGPNSGATGYGDYFLINPWDYILAMEGTLLFSGAVARRLESHSAGMPSFPFTVFPTAAGWDTVSSEEASGSRGEMWLPLWNKPATLGEIKYLYSEGRAHAGKGRAATGLDFARAVATLGVDRGISSFKRLGFLSGGRFGKMYFSVTLGEFPVKEQPEAYLLEDLDRWLKGLRNFAGKREAPARFRVLLRRIEDAVFAYCRYGGAGRLQDVLLSTGLAEQGIAGSESSRPWLSPLLLSPGWLKAADDGTPEYRIAAAVASIFSEDEPGSIRENIEPVVRKRGKWQWEQTGKQVSLTDLVRTFSAILEKRLLLAKRHNLGHAPLASRINANHADINAFLGGFLDERKILSLLTGLVLVDWSAVKEGDLPSWKIADDRPDSLYSLLKLLFLPAPLSWPPGSKPVSVKLEPALLGLLRSGNVAGGIEVALRRLQASGFTPWLNAASKWETGFFLSEAKRKRLAPALLIPAGRWRRMAETALFAPSPEGAVLPG